MKDSGSTIKSKERGNPFRSMGMSMTGSGKTTCDMEKAN